MKDRWVRPGGLALFGAALSACATGAASPWYDGDPEAFVPWEPGGTPDASTGLTQEPDAAAGAPDAAGSPDTAGARIDAGSAIATVFVVLMAKQSWSAIGGSRSAPYINGTLLPMGAHAENYRAPLPMFPYSLPNLIGIEVGGSLGLTANGTPAQEANGTPHHLVNQLEAAGVSWRAYVENIAPGQCPIQDQGQYTTWHVPFLYFDDVVGNPPASTATRCIAHVVPFGHLAQDLQSGSAPQYAFVVPNECNDMHQDCNTGDPVRQGDDWLAAHIPELLNSSAYARGGLVMIAWDFSPHGDVPIGLIALSAKARPGYASTAPFTVSSTLRSLQEIFGVSPLLGGASSASDLSDLFTAFP